ncbi:MAG: endonuclease/exonuclease/phosphatase family protein [Cytophagales bacterium]|nr:endonuclease/exonuclease/phosphatase family protein [Cytophagales bacterium]
MLAIKVLTVNIHKGFTALNRQYMLPELREAVRSVAADVVFLQEVTGSNTRHAALTSRFAHEPHYEYLADSIWTQYAYGRNSVYTHGHHGNAVLSKFPIVHFQNRDVSVSQLERRGLLHCVLNIPLLQTPLHVICVHFNLLSWHRSKQLMQLCTFVREVVPPLAPLIVAGDFNDWEERACAVLRNDAHLTEIFVSQQGRAARTFPARLPILRLDRIYVRNVVSHSPIHLPPTPWRHLSDHAPLAATIELN